MEVLGLERKFMLKNVSGESVLDDIDPNWAPDQIKDHYASVYPELTNAKIVDNGIVDGRHEIMFKTIAGTKG
ncbi:MULTISPECIES: PRTRC system protein C [Flagellimonas]|uniref:PRTRC system protein C n=2 Tax=Flagellimonas TaxID=444459 RepID=A0A3A1NGI4_9FLAO|nr:MULTISPECIES: PRTRC system protein C [Allomuricauda]MBW8242903.1 PRTRC system protein C [Allomuricauda oceani]QII45370.1 PRTRC system protein C [Allomuricauda oceani]RIV42809.1 PRTRC system protein C [Allomuricauda maritima]TXJ92003.1 PRTRC system protein C [Allomuricauda maritima]|tara:strand:+ start:969 stop:1184 length:216 start_codon:yes stop_codon:yes gene_type:complete